MPVTERRAYASAFDAVALRYDVSFTFSKVGHAQRVAVWSELAKTFNPGERVIEVGCGTGVDACFLAHRAVRVLACDNSPRMIELAASRIRQAGLGKLVQAQLLSAESLARLSDSELFDGVFSNFGALNCVEDLRQLAQDIARLLKPNASVLLCWMGPHCLWEVIWYLLQGQRAKAFRRFNKNGITAKLTDEAFVWLHYPSVRLIARTFAPEFRLKSIKGIGIAVPPTYLENVARKHPLLFKLCERADSILSRCPGIRVLGDHLLVRLQRVGSSQSVG